MKSRIGFVANSSSTSIIIDPSYYKDVERDAIKKLLQYSIEKPIPKLIDTNTSESQYCILEDGKIVLHIHGDSIPDFIYDNEDGYQRVESSDVYWLTGDNKKLVAPFAELFEKYGVAVNDDMMADIQKLLEQLLFPDDF